MSGLESELPSFPEIEAEIGENPARWLDQNVGKDGQTEELTARALIRGIEDIERLRAWITVEADLGHGTNGGPRQRVIAWLNHRQAELTDDTTRAQEREQNTDASGAAQDADQSERSKPSKQSEPDELSERDDSAEDAHPRCPTCGEGLKAEEIAGQRGYWCLECREFREPTSDPPSPSVDAVDPTLGESSPTATVATDGGAPDPDISPRCPDCHGELPEETVGDDDAVWCAFCGATKRVEQP